MLNLSPTFFERHLFPPLKSTQAAEFLQSKIPDITQPKIENLYTGWLLTFHRKATLFYLSQYRRHERAVYVEFRQYYDIPEGDSPDQYGRRREWEQCLDFYGLRRHYDEYEHLTTGMAELDEAINRHRETRGTSLDDLYAIANETTVFNGIDALWFNNSIRSSETDIAELRELPYPVYLITPHWKRVRAAMLLIRQARCQALDCYGSGDSWYGGGWESDLHVHHLSYINRGNERFEDLALLCSRHHEQWHEEVRTYGEARFEIIQRPSI